MLSMQEEDTRKQITGNLYIYTYVRINLCMYVNIIDWVGVFFFAAFC